MPFYKTIVCESTEVLMIKANNLRKESTTESLEQAHDIEMELWSREG